MDLNKVYAAANTLKEFCESHGPLECARCQFNGKYGCELHVIPAGYKKYEVEIMKIKIKYHGDVEKIKKIDCGDWLDLRAAEDVTMNYEDYKLISLGVSMQLPEGYEAHVLPRSSTFKNFGITMSNSEGIIDNSYCGDNDIWRFPAICMRKSGTVIKKGDRIAQFRIVKKQPVIEFEEVETLGNADRGGIGSTGVK